MRTHLTLLRWLGPLSREDRAPTDVDREEISITGFRAWHYAGHSPPRGALLVCPGIHFAGPADPRLDRFNRILASSGIRVLSPFLPDFVRMIITERVVEDLDLALSALIDRLPAGVRPGLFSISFGSLPVLRVAGLEHRRDRISGVVVFGGYADFSATVRHCLSGENRDPLNQPVVLMNLIRQIPGAPRDPEPICEAWRRYMGATWGRPEMKARHRYEPIARRIAEEVAPEDRRLFLVGCGVDGSALELLSPILERQSAPFLDPRPHLGSIRCPVHLVHGRGDDVIPADQLERLREAMPSHVRVETYLTGLYGHTGRSPVAAIGDAAREIATLLRMMRAIVDVARG